MTQLKPREVLRVYDSGEDGPLDRFTVILTRRGYRGLKWNRYPYFALSANPDWPLGVSQYGEGAMLGRHLGRRIDWEALPERVRRHVLDRLGEEKGQ